MATGDAGQEEHFDVLTKTGQKTGVSKPRGDVHRDGDYHRAVHVWIFAEKTQELLLQRRSDCKDSWPGLWDISSAGHISAGDTSLITARRELQEELGVILPKDAFEMIFVFLQECIINDGKFINNEYNDVYLVTTLDPIPLEAFTLQMSNLIVPVEFHFPAKVITRSGGVMIKIKEKFEKFDLIEKAKSSPFGHFVIAPPLQFSSVIIHHLLLRKVHSKYQNELHFNVGGKNLRFGIAEFALIIGLNFGPDLDQAKFEEITKSRRIAELYLNDKDDVRLGDLEAAFLKCNEKDDAWKLGLCYLVAGLLMSSEANGSIYRSLLAMVDDEEEFYKFPWGRHAYYNTLNGLSKNMVSYKEKYFTNLKEKNPEKIS